jgi:hypothetical protein
VVGLAKHVEQLLNVKLEVADTLFIVAPHTVHLVANVLGSGSRVLESFLQVGNLGLETSDQAVVACGDFLQEVGLFAFDLCKSGFGVANIL